YQTYNGYVMSQFKKLSGDIRNKGEVKWKHVMHLIRLLISGVTLLREGRVPVRLEAGEREKLLAVKRGEVSWEEANAGRLRLGRGVVGVISIFGEREYGVEVREGVNKLVLRFDDVETVEPGDHVAAYHARQRRREAEENGKRVGRGPMVEDARAIVEFAERMK